MLEGCRPIGDLPDPVGPVGSATVKGSLGSKTKQGLLCGGSRHIELPPPEIRLVLSLPVLPLSLETFLFFSLLFFLAWVILFLLLPMFCLFCLVSHFSIISEFFVLYLKIRLFVILL